MNKSGVYQTCFDPLIKLICSAIEKKTEVINIPTSFQYLTQHQASITKDALSVVIPSYDNATLISLIADFIQKHLPNTPITVVDLGVGPSLTPPQFHNDLLNKLKPACYIGLDSSQNILNLLQNSAEFKHLPCPSRPLQCSFEDLIPDRHPLQPLIKTANVLYLFLGFTYSNFDKAYHRKFLRSILRPGDCIAIVASYVRDAQDGIERVMKKYELNPDLLTQKKEFECLTLMELGFLKEDLEFFYRFNQKTLYQEGTTRVLRLSPSVDNRLIRAGLRPGQLFRTILSRKLTPDQFKQELDGFGLESEIHTINMFNFALAQRP